jgi:diaminohydroxyphosphoribosylaminopyrimidine deaminase/5-amino-6-(5-phosphoribosylamino)uracil reductase
VSDRDYMRLALTLARRGYGTTSPNPMVGAVLVKRGRIIGRGWHDRAGDPHAEIEALKNAEKRRGAARGATLYVSLEPCSTHGRTPPCTEAILAAGIQRVVVGATDPNPRHRGKAFAILRRAGVAVTHGILAEDCDRLNEAFNHWIVHRTPFVMVKAAMTLDGKIATASGESKWITGEPARAFGMKLRQGADAVLVGINTILADDPALTVRTGSRMQPEKKLRRIVLDSFARTPLRAKVVSDAKAELTTIVVSEAAPKSRVRALAERVSVLVAPTALAASKGPRRPTAASRAGSGTNPPPVVLDLSWLLKQLGSKEITSLLVEGGGEVNASFLMEGLAQRIAFFYAPKILGGRQSHKGVAGEGGKTWDDIIRLDDLEWQRIGVDWLLTARCGT